MMAAIILSSLALAAATGSIVFTFRERKRNLERNAAQMEYAEQVGKDAVRKANVHTDAGNSDLEKKVAELKNGVAELKNGVVPDFEKAKAAAEAVNNFNAGISGILGYDPFDALKAARAKEDGGVFE